MRCKMLFLVAILLCAVSTRAQYRASIQGVVTDRAGGVVSGATLTLTNLDTNLQLTATSDESGVYNFVALPPAKFSLAVEKAGFKKKFLQNVGVIAEQSNALNIQLELGQVTESVTVSGDSTPLIDTETASINGTVNSNQIQHLPSFGRDPLKLAQLPPGAFANASQGSAGGTFNLPAHQTGAGASRPSPPPFKTQNRSPPISNRP